MISYTIEGSTVPLSLASLSKLCFLHQNDGYDTACAQLGVNGINSWSLADFSAHEPLGFLLHTEAD